MHVLKLVAENYKRIKFVEIEPDGNLVVVAGKNGAGKSSVLDAIWHVLQKSSAGKETTNPIRDGEQEAFAQLYFDDLVVTREWSRGKPSRLIVRDSEGNKKRSPQKLLDSLVGKLSFDPMAFAGMPPKEQVAALLEVVVLPFDPEELEKKRATLFETRTSVNRDVKKLTGQLAGMPRPEKGLPEEEVSVAELLEEHDLAVRKKRRAEELLDKCRVAAIEVEVAKVAYHDALESQKRALAAAAKIPDDLPDPDTIKARIDSAEQTNAAIRAANSRKAVAAELEVAQGQAKNMTDMLDKIDKEKSDGLKQAAFPVDGLGFNSAGVTFNAQPFRQCCASERLRVSCAVAMALNPKVRVIRVTDGSLLDSESMAMLQELAAEHDAQVWLEVVDESGEVGVVIEDGSVVAVNEVAV